MNILMLEDDPAIAQGLRYSLESEGYTVTHCATVARALETVGAGRFDLCLLDLTLPDGSGYDVCKAIKAKDDTPVIFLTAFDDEVNVVMGLELGADDYISKPFRLRELMARIKTVLRRCWCPPTTRKASCPFWRITFTKPPASCKPRQS